MRTRHLPDLGCDLADQPEVVRHEHEAAVPGCARAKSTGRGTCVSSEACASQQSGHTSARSPLQGGRSEWGPSAQQSSSRKGQQLGSNMAAATRVTHAAQSVAVALLGRSHPQPCKAVCVTVWRGSVQAGKARHDGAGTPVRTVDACRKRVDRLDVQVIGGLICSGLGRRRQGKHAQCRGLQPWLAFCDGKVSGCPS